MTKYEQAYADHSYLWKIGAGYDMTGAYVDSEDLDKMLKTPTKKMATECLCSQISHWFVSGFDRGDSYRQEAQSMINSDFKVREIAERHGHI